MKDSRTSICLFGVHPVRVNGVPCYVGISGATEKLFQYLLINAGKETRREYLAELFWRRSSPERQRSALNSAIWRIKQQLRSIEDIDIACYGSTVYMQISPNVNIDTRNLSEIVHSISLNRPVNEETAAKLFAALNECDAPFMEGVTSEWVLTERERLFNIKIRGMTVLMHWCGEQRLYEDALEIGRRLLAEDPFREAAQCEVMWLYVLNGQRAQALRQYEEYRQLLNQEMNIAPMPETEALYHHIHSDLNCEDGTHVAQQSKGNEGAFHPPKLNRLLGAIEQSRRDMYRTIRTQLG